MVFSFAGPQPSSLRGALIIEQLSDCNARRSLAHHVLFRTNAWEAAMPAMVNDLRYAIRQLKKTPGFALVCVLTLALGIGANTAVFSVMNVVLLRSLPVADPARVVYLRTTNPPPETGTVDSNATFSYPVYDALRRQNRGLSPVMAYVPLATGKVAVRYGELPEQAEGDMVSGTFFSGLGVKLAYGRGFSEQDESNHAPIAVISYGYWTRRFASAPDVLGKTLYVNGVPLTIVGVATQGFEGVEAGGSTDFWIPLQSRPELNAWGAPVDDGKTYLTRPTWWCLRLMGRLAPGVSQAQAVAQLQAAFQAAAYVGLGDPRPGEKKPVLSLQEVKSFPGYEEEYGRPLRILMSMVGLVLLIALSNVVMLLMARNATRQREFSVRLALGAGRKQLLRQLLSESLLLVSAGALLAWFFADWPQGAGCLGADRVKPGAGQHGPAFHPEHLSAGYASIWARAAARRALRRAGAGVENIRRDLAYGCRQIARRQNHCRSADDPMCCAAGGRWIIGAHLAQSGKYSTGHAGSRPGRLRSETQHTIGSRRRRLLSGADEQAASFARCGIGDHHGGAPRIVGLRQQPHGDRRQVAGFDERRVGNGAQQRGRARLLSYPRSTHTFGPRFCRFRYRDLTPRRHHQ